ncbi:MAG: DUF4330 family protein [Oscillospiraceae bacterium]|nr:DUF4330 family protein [Oscillospiraceae bacterium]
MKLRKPNWVDILIILAVIIVGLGIFWRMTGQVENATAKSSRFYYTVETQKLRQMGVDGIEKSVGKQFNMSDKARSDFMGTLLSYEARPAQKEIEMADGSWVWAEIPERYDVTLFFEIDGQVNDVGYFTPQLSNLGAGCKVILKSKFVYFEGHVGKVWE